MAPRKAVARKTVSVEQDVETVEDVRQFAPNAPEPEVLQPAMKNAKIKGTWTMYYGTEKYDFVDGHRYDLPLELFEYLKSAGNIYDTL
jgi:hypothetical protein